MIFSAYVFGIVSSSVAGTASDRFGRGPVVTAGIVLCVLGVTLTLAHVLAVVVAGIMLLTIGFFIAHSAASAWVSRLGGAHRSHAASLYLLAYYAGASTIGALGGWFWQHGGWGALVGMWLTLLAIALRRPTSCANAPTTRVPTGALRHILCGVSEADRPTLLACPLAGGLRCRRRGSRRTCAKVANRRARRRSRSAS